MSRSLHICNVHDRPCQLCIDRKGGQHSPQPRECLHPVCHPSFLICYGALGWAGVGRVYSATKQQPYLDLNHLLDNSFGDFMIPK
ncbi:hypothetical protein CDL12_08787 [Handroanthus impetiginosus]|uniref:Uncharacterized protein n=1 Tax=Handroanthus impetiginosus TaxID=429701 RepID=A0A2G9HLY8_9LAMI|nr:hypothetical protein CDL12_08787 [Handroanthus impetiginosus]